MFVRFFKMLHKRALSKASRLKQSNTNITTIILQRPLTLVLYLKNQIYTTQSVNMPERRQAVSSSANSRSTTGVRRNLFHQHLSRRPTTSSTSTSAETLRLDTEHESETSDIVIRNKDGEFEIGDLQVQGLDEQEEDGEQNAQEDESMFFRCR